MASQNLGDSQNDIQPQKILQKALHNLNAILDGYSISDKKIDNWILKKYVKMQTIPFLIPQLGSLGWSAKTEMYAFTGSAYLHILAKLP